MIKLFLIDDHQFIIDGVTRNIESNANIEIIGSSTNPEHICDLLIRGEVVPDIIISDISMPQMTGFELLKSVRAAQPEIKFVMLTMHDEPEIVTEIADAGAEGYLLKSGNPEHFIDAIHRVYNGGTYYSSEVIHHLFSQVRRQQKSESELANFTEREIEILKLVLKEMTSQEIADTLFISKQTVDTHRKNILHKSGETNIIGLVKFGLRNGLYSPADA